MREKSARAAGRAVVATAVAVTGLAVIQPVQAAAPADVRVPCRAAALASAVAGAVSGAALELAPYCVYDLTTALPVVTGKLTVQGNHATIRRSSAAGTPRFTILKVGNFIADAPGAVVISNLNFSRGDPAIGLEDGTATVNGGTFSGNSLAIGSYFSTTLTVSGATFAGNTGKYGGAVSTSHNARVDDSTFTGNRAMDGGAIFSEEGGLAISHCHFVDNSARSSGGAVSNSGHATVTTSSFIDNTARGLGGAINNYNPDVASLTVTASTFTGGSAQAGGAVYNYNSALLNGSTFTSNRASQGGAIDSDGPVGAADDVFSNNTAREVGGVIYSTEGADILDSLLRQNQAGLYGGAVYLALPFFTTSEELTITGTSIAGNVARTDGGGIYDAAGSRGSVTLTGTTVARNRPDNCAPAGSVAGCAGPAGIARRG
jgi:predicted outer membrane repeat protein